MVLASPHWGEPSIRPTILHTKLWPSGLRAGLVDRPRLVDRVLESPYPVVVVCAPVGYGKTTLLAQCAAAMDHPAAWVSLDASDNDPVLLLSEIASAINQVTPVDPAVFESLLTPEPAIQREILPALLNTLESAPGAALLLDDVHLVEARESIDALTMLCERLPKGWKLVLAARQQLSLPLARLRAHGMLLELGPAELAFSAREARRLLESGHLPVDAEEFESVYERTEGWAAGLYLGAEERYVTEYLSTELLRGQSGDVLTFLVQTSLLDRFCSSLCDAVLERDDSGAVIAQLQRQTGFLVPLDQRQTWFRYHHLLAAVLRQILQQTAPARMPGFHDRASRWHQRHGTPAEAIEHALASGDHLRAADLFARNVRSLFNTGNQSTLRRWIHAFSDEDLAECPQAAAGAAWVLGQLGERAPTRRCITILEHADSTGPFPFGESSSESVVALLKAAFAWEGLTQMRALAEAAYRVEPAGTEAHERAALFLGANLFLRGRFDAAVELLEEAAGAGDGDASTTVFALGLLALAQLELQRPNEARVTIRDGLALMDPARLHAYTASGALFIARASLELQRGNSDAAQAYLEQATSLMASTAAVPWWSILLALWSSRVALGLNDVDQAELLLAHARRGLARFPDSGMLPHWLARQERAFEAAVGGAGFLREPLTEAEMRVLEFAPTHLTLEEIGHRLCISRNTVKTHLKVIYSKLSVSSRGEAVDRARSIGLITTR